MFIKVSRYPLCIVSACTRNIVKGAAIVGARVGFAWCQWALCEVSTTLWMMQCYNFWVFWKWDTHTFVVARYASVVQVERRGPPHICEVAGHPLSLSPIMCCPIGERNSELEWWSATTCISRGWISGSCGADLATVCSSRTCHWLVGISFSKSSWCWPLYGYPEIEPQLFRKGVLPIYNFLAATLRSTTHIASTTRGQGTYLVCYLKVSHTRSSRLSRTDFYPSLGLIGKACFSSVSSFNLSLVSFLNHLVMLIRVPLYDWLSRRMSTFTSLKRLPGHRSQFLQVLLKWHAFSHYVLRLSNVQYSVRKPVNVGYKDQAW